MIFSATADKSFLYLLYAGLGIGALFGGYKAYKSYKSKRGTGTWIKETEYQATYQDSRGDLWDCTSFSGGWMAMNGPGAINPSVRTRLVSAPTKNELPAVIENTP